LASGQEDTAAFDAHTRTPQRLAHLGQRAGPVLERDLQVPHRITRAGADAHVVEDARDLGR
jgi:hypothetical protein